MDSPSRHRRESSTSHGPPKHRANPGPAAITLDQNRQRAFSEVVRNDLTSGKWRIVGAWSSLRRSLDTALHPEEPPSHLPTLSDPPDPSRPSRKRVSLFLRRCRPSPTADPNHQPDLVLETGEPIAADPSRSTADFHEDEEPATGQFRRTRSQIVKPVSGEHDSGGGEGGRYMRYAAELDDDSFKRLRKFVRPGGIRIVKSPPCTPDRQSWGHEAVADGGDIGREDDVVRQGGVEALEEFYVEREGGQGGIEDDGDGESDEIIGEICLEDFADVGSEDFDFLDNQSVDLSVLEPGSIGRLPRRPSLKLDSQKVRWIGNEAEFAAFFAEVGLDEWFDVERTVELKEFDVGEDMFREWEAAVEEHNAQCLRWETKAVRKIVDIRDFERDFRDARRRKERRRRAEGVTTAG